MSIDIEQLVLNALKKISEENAFRRATLLNILHLNIDLLLQNAFQWFKDDIPEDYRKVINSLMTLTTSFLEEEWDMEDRIFENTPEIVDVAAILNAIANEINVLFGFADSRISLEAEKNYQVLAPRKEVTRAIYSIILAHYPYMTEDSRCRISVAEDVSNIVVSLEFSGLDTNFPGMDKIQKSFYTYQSGESNKIGMGIDAAISSLREMGAMTKVKQMKGGNHYRINISFPSLAFLRTIDEIRKTQPAYDKKENPGNIIVVVEDLITEMVLGELFKDRGYGVIFCDVNKMKSLSQQQEYEGLIIDCDFVKKEFEPMEDFGEIVSRFAKTVFLYNDICPEQIRAFEKKDTLLLKKPIEIDRIIRHIEMG